jgi:hypothetical protein
MGKDAEIQRPVKLQFQVGKRQFHIVPRNEPFDGFEMFPAERFAGTSGREAA